MMTFLLNIFNRKDFKKLFFGRSLSKLDFFVRETKPTKTRFTRLYNNIFLIKKIEVRRGWPVRKRDYTQLLKQPKATKSQTHFKNFFDRSVYRI